MMPRAIFTALSALTLSLVMGAACPAWAQKAPEEGAAKPAARTVSGRDLMTRDERASFRREMEQASPEQRQKIWARKHEDLSKRAATRGVVLAEAAPKAEGGAATARRGAEKGDGDGRGPRTVRMVERAPRAP